MLRRHRFTIILAILITSSSAGSPAYGAGFCDRVLHHVRRIFGRGAPVSETARETAHAAAAASTTAVREAVEFAPRAAENFTERRAQAWITQQKCLSCHTILPYTIARFSGAGADAEAMNQIRQYIVGRIDGWDNARPWYPEKADESRATELIISSFFLTQAEEAGAGARERVTKALQLMSQFQGSDGSFPWLNYNLQPFESDEAKPYGAAIAAISYGQLEASQRAEFAPQIQKVKDYLRKVWEHSNVTELNRLHVAWADSELDGIVSKTEIKRAFKSIRDKQNSDGGWSINQLSKWTKQGNSEMAGARSSDSYATAYVLFVLKKTGLKDDPVFDDAYKKGISWLKSHQQSSGGWESPSLNTTAPMNLQLASDYASGFAWAVLKGH